MPNVNIERIERQIMSLFDFNAEDILKISAKMGSNVPSVLDAIIERFIRLSFPFLC